MTPQERQLVMELFDRLASLESERRDPEAERAIAEGLSLAPNALYALVQTVLVQDAALARVDARVRELEASLGKAPRGGFLDGMRGALPGRDNEPRGSVPSVRPDGKWNSGQTNFATSAPPDAPAAQEPAGRGGSFLGTAAAVAAGAIGGSLLLNGVRSMMGGHRGESFSGAIDRPASEERRSPWDDAAGSDLARDAGLGDIGSGRSERLDGGGQRMAGLVDDSASEGDDGFADDDSADDGGDDFAADDISDA